MELIIISKNKIKLMLTSEDMAAYQGNTREMLREIITDAHEKCGLIPYCGKILVTMYQSREGGCELFVTGLEEQTTVMKMNSAEEKTLTEYKRYVFRDRHVIYSFSSLDCMLKCCLGLLQMNYDGSSAAYVDKTKQRYYLALDCETYIAGENLGSLCPNQIYYYINEHCDIICADGAAEVLGKLA